MKILIQGCGSIGARHARNLHKAGHTHLLLADPDPARALALACLTGGTPVSPESAYEYAPEAVVIATPTSLHLEQARAALQHGCHVLLEKPVSHTLAGIDGLLNEAANRIVMVGYNLQFDPLVQQVNHWVRSGAIGRVLTARFHVGGLLSTRHPWEDYRIGYGARADLGGGVILDSSHEIDWAIRLFGMPEAVFCTGGKLSDMEIDVEDVAEISLRYPRRIVSIHLNFVQHPARRYCEIIGADGQIHADLRTRRAQGPAEYTAACGPDEVYEREIAHWIDCIQHNRQPRFTLRDAVDTLRVALHARESMRAGLPRRMAA